jgi:hypothetical protein
MLTEGGEKKMDEQKLVELMRSVIKEELNPLNQRFQEMNQIIYALRDGQEELKAQIKGNFTGRPQTPWNC